MPASLFFRKISPSLMRHLAAGAPALLLDALGMESLFAAGLNIHAARALSVIAATAAAFFLHRRFTYASQQKARTIHGQPVPFATLQAAAGVLSYGIFLRVLYSLPHPVGFGGRIFALLIGAAAGFFFNYLMLHRLLPAEKIRSKFAKGAVKAPLVSTKKFKRVLLWLVIACLTLQSVRGHHQSVMSYPGLKEPLAPYDPDPWVRLTQVRQWLTDGLAGFFDHTVRNINAPFGGITTPWTRPLDMIITAFYTLTPHDLPMNTRLMLSATWMAPCIGLMAIAFLTLAVRRHFNNLHALGFVALLILFSPDTFYYFTPGSSDHHGLLSALWCGVLAMLMWRDYPQRAALAAGGILGLMVWISPEALMLTGATFALLGVMALSTPNKAPALAWTALGAAAVATLGLFFEVPPDKIFSQKVYDSLSIVQVALLSFTAGAAGALAWLYRRKLNFGERFFGASVAGSSVLLAMHIFYPRFFLGPLADVDPFIFTGFLPRVGEAKMLFKNTFDDIIRELMEPVLAGVLAFLSLHRGYVRPERRQRILQLSALLVVTTIMTLWQIRWAYYMHPVAIVLAAMTIASIAAMPKERPWIWLRHLPRQGRPYIILWLAFFTMNFFIRLYPSVLTESASCMSQVRYVIQTQQLQPLLGSKNIVLFAPEDVGGDLLFFTPYRIIASNYHREGAGLKDVSMIFKAKTPQEALPLLKKREVSAMLYCPAFEEKTSWLSAENAKKRPPWMVPVPGLHFMTAPGRKPVLFRLKGVP
jgi:putative flippase GtrA